MAEWSWIKFTPESMPALNTPVETKSHSGGTVSVLVLRETTAGKRWFTDGPNPMYIYYNVAYWRPL